MQVGLPGTGIGGLFYILCALLMPFLELPRTLRGESSWARWQMVARQFGLAIGIIIGLWGTSFMIDGLVSLAGPIGTALIPTAIAGTIQWTGAGGVSQLVGTTPTLLAPLTLGAVLFGTQLLGLVVSRRPPLRANTEHEP